MRTFKIICPRCGKRLFDIYPEAKGTISVKCPRCKIFSILDLIAACHDKGSEPQSKDL